MTDTRRFQELKVALVYDHLTTSFGGAELVLETLHSIFPQAPLYTSVCQLPKNSWADLLTVKTSFLQNIPVIKTFHQVLAPLHPLAFESFNMAEYDIIISVSNGPSKGVLTLPHQLHLCYMLSPTRYLHDPQVQKEYIKSHGLLALPGMAQLIHPFFSYLQQWDAVAAHRPDVIIAISQLVANRVEKIYNRLVDDIIYPPFKQTTTKPRKLESDDFFLCLTRLTSYKKIDFAIAAALKTGHTLIIAGDGKEKKSLISQSSSNTYIRNSQQSLVQTLAAAQAASKQIIFLGNVTEVEKHQLLESCLALVMPGEEDFGLVGLEAASHGKPTVTCHTSGIAEVLKDKHSAIHLKEKSVSALITAFSRFKATSFSANKIKNTVTEYEVEWFKELFHKTIYHFWQQHSTIAGGS